VARSDADASFLGPDCSRKKLIHQANATQRGETATVESAACPSATDKNSNATYLTWLLSSLPAEAVPVLSLWHVLKAYTKRPASFPALRTYKVPRPPHICSQQSQPPSACSCRAITHTYYAFLSHLFNPSFHHAVALAHHQ